MSTTLTDLIFAAALDSVSLVGAMPDGPVEAAAHLRKWCEIIRRHDPQLSQITDDQIQDALGRV
jgi:hypothetical protein